MFDSPSTPFQRLAAKGAQGQWSVADIRDWDGDVGAPKWLPRKFQSALISQFYHGELATLKMCRRVLTEIGDPEAKRCLSFQIADEERHARIYLAYLEKTGGRLQPVDPVLEAAYDKALAWSGPPEGLICAFNIVLEGEALFALDYLGGWLTCPLFKRINERISRDEARHLAFGRIYLAGALKALETDQRLDIYRWLKGLWRDTAFRVMDRFWIPNMILVRRCRIWAETGWRDHRKALIGVGLLSHEEARLAEGRTP